MQLFKNLPQFSRFGVCFNKKVKQLTPKIYLQYIFLRKQENEKNFLHFCFKLILQLKTLHQLNTHKKKMFHIKQLQALKYLLKH